MNTGNKKKDSDHLDSVDIFPTIAIILVFSFLVFGFYLVVDDLSTLKERKVNLIEESVEDSISLVEGIIIDEKLYGLVEAEDRGLSDDDVQDLIQQIIATERVRKAEVVKSYRI